MYQKQLDLVEHDLVSLAEAMPADKYEFRPAGGIVRGRADVRRAGQARGDHDLHDRRDCARGAIALRARRPATTGRTPSQGKTQIVDYLKASIAYARKAMASLNEKNQLDPLRTYFGSQPRVAVAAGIAFHSYDHYGQMVVYARMNGVTPPSTSSARLSARP